MRGDDTQRIAGGASRARNAPRHAAPRKSLLTKLQIPAGKAMALAAMPTAVFVGMGLTPRLALAGESQDIPFAPGPCVTRSDEPPESASASPSPSGSTEPGEAPPASPEPSPSTSGPAAGQDHTEPGPQQSPAAGDPGTAADEGQPDAPGSAPASPALSGAGAPAPSATPSHNPLDPLGLGDVVGGILGGPGKDAAGGPAPSASATTQTPAAQPSGQPVKPTSGPTPRDLLPGGLAGVKPGGTAGAKTGGPVGTSKDAIKEAAKKAGATVAELDEDAKGLEAGKDDDIPAGAQGKEPYPCPTPDPGALADATEEQGIPLLANEPWTLNSSKLTLRELTYHGIKKVRTYDNTLKYVLKFTAEQVDIQDLRQTAVFPGGRTAHVEAGAGSTSTIRDGQVTMYVEELKGNLLGIIPITFSPATPPPVNISPVFFTDVTVTQAGQFGGNLHIPGLHNYITG